MLLRQARFPVTIIPADIDETPLPGQNPREHAIHLAREKARVVARDIERGLILGADTVVSFDDRIIGKPVDAADARRILSQLSGSVHECLTALCLIDKPSGREFCAIESTKIFMDAISPAMIEEYIATGEWQGKAGAYAIQEKGDRFVRRIEGSFTNVVGLPLETLEQLLARRDACTE